MIDSFKLNRRLKYARETYRQSRYSNHVTYYSLRNTSFQKRWMFVENLLSPAELGLNLGLKAGVRVDLLLGGVRVLLT